MAESILKNAFVTFERIPRHRKPVKRQIKRLQTIKEEHAQYEIKEEAAPFEAWFDAFFDGKEAKKQKHIWIVWLGKGRWWSETRLKHDRELLTQFSLLLDEAIRKIGEE